MRRVTVLRVKRFVTILSLGLVLLVPSTGLAASFAVWLDGNLSDGGNAIPNRLNSFFGAGSATLVTTAQLETAGFLSAYDAIVVSRYDASFGTYLTTTAAANVAAWVGSGASQGGVALFTNDMADNLLGSGSGDPYDVNLDRLFTNAATFAAQSGHGYIGEFNGAVQAVASNGDGAYAMGLLQGSATAVGRYGPLFNYDVGPVGAGNPIDLGVSFPFTDTDTSTFLTRISGADSGNIVDIYVDTLSQGSINDLPAVLANNYVIQGGKVPEPSTMLLLGSGLVGLIGYRRRKRMI